MTLVFKGKNRLPRKTETLILTPPLGPMIRLKEYKNGRQPELAVETRKRGHLHVRNITEFLLNIFGIGTD